MTSTFTFSKEDVLCLSLSLNALYLLQFVTSRIVHWALPALSGWGSRWRTLQGLHHRWPNLLGRLLMEQFSLFTLLILVLVNLGYVTSVVPPFSHHPDGDEDDDVISEGRYIQSGVDYDLLGAEVEAVHVKSSSTNNNNNNGNYHLLTRIILSVSTARFLLIVLGIVQNSSHRDNNPPIRITSTDTRSAHIDLVYCAFGIASNVLGMGYKQNLLLLITSSFMELNTTSLVICRLIKLSDRHRCCKSYLKTSILCCATFLFSRVLLPVLFLCHALVQESPFVMDKVPLVWFFVSAAFHLVFHAISMFYSVRRIVRAYALLAEGASHSCANHEPFSVCNYSERLMNDIYNDFDEIPDFDVEKDAASLDSEELKFKCNPTTKLRDLNYGFLAPYDNRNLCSFVTGVEEEKMNFLQTKNVSKNEFVYRFLMKGGGRVNSVSGSSGVSDGCGGGGGGGDGGVGGVSDGGSDVRGSGGGSGSCSIDFGCCNQCGSQLELCKDVLQTEMVVEVDKSEESVMTSDHDAG